MYIYNIREVKEVESLNRMIQETEAFESVKEGNLISLSGVARSLGINETLVSNPRFMSIFSNFVQQLDRQIHGQYPNAQKGEIYHLPYETMIPSEAEELEEGIKSQNHFLTFKEAIDFSIQNEKKADCTGGFSYVAIKITEDGNVNFYECNYEKRPNTTDLISSSIKNISITEDGGFEILNSRVAKDNLTGSIISEEYEKIAEFNKYGISIPFNNKKTFN